MLKSLQVENYALIEHLEMELDPTLNIITGETGAGKSILLGALGLLLGGKNDGSATRDNTKSCVIEGLFSIASLDLRELFDENDWDYEEEVTIRRVITASGKSRSFVGDIPVSLSELKGLSSRLIDIHSQHQNQILADELFRIRSLDMLYDSSALLRQYRERYNELQQLHAELRTIEEIAASARRDEEWLTHQVEELTAANLRLGESEEAEAQLQILENAEAIGNALGMLVEILDGDDDRTILISLRSAEKELQSVSKSLPTAGEYAIRLRSVIEELKDLKVSAVDDMERIESDPERLAKLSERIDTLYTLCQKHRAQNLEELIEIRDRYTEQLQTIHHSDEKISAVKLKINECESATKKLAAKISEHRCKAAPKFSTEICTTLRRLGMEQARFEVSVTSTQRFTPSGCDSVEFLFSSVEGKSLQGVDKIGSGGEISRVMLALKALLAERSELPTIIFDEIDTGVSGRIAEAMGEIIAELSQRMQVIDITHLPQVASKGNSHYVVYKDAGHTNITKLSPDERVNHIATMLSGSQISDAAVTQARILLGR
ncbi:MAG: DNA repair protein RecN [Rikenellaceae bacterium]